MFGIAGVPCQDPWFLRFEEKEEKKNESVWLSAEEGLDKL